MTPDTEIVARLERLERENRRLKRLGMIALIVAASLGAIYAARPVPDVIEAHAFRVVDPTGLVRVALDKNTLYFFNSSGRRMISLINAQNGSGLEFSGTKDQEIGGKLFPVARMSLTTWGLNLSDSDGTPAIGLGGNNPVMKNGQLERDLNLYNTQGKASAQIVVSKDNEPAISLSAGDNGPLAVIRASQRDGSQVSLSGNPMAAGKSWAVSLNVAPNTGEPSIILADPQGFETNLGSAGTVNGTTGETRQTSAASIVMFGNDKEHHVIWRAP